MSVSAAENESPRCLQFLVKSSLRFAYFITKQKSWQIWKETEPEVFWYFEKTFQAQQVAIRLTADESTFLVDMIVPLSAVEPIETSIKDGSLGMELDKIHGIDESVFKRKDVICVMKLTSQSKPLKAHVALAPEIPKSQKSIRTIENLERRLMELEMRERARSIDIKGLVTELQGFQIEYYKRLEDLEVKVNQTLEGLGVKCDKLEKIVERYRVVPL